MNTIKEKIEKIADTLLSSTIEGSDVYIKNLEVNVKVASQGLVETEYKINVWQRMPYDNKGID